MYRSGDQARRRADGTLDFLGRADDQVKIRGFRIEPGEIEASLRLQAEVAQAAVIARDDGPGGKYLAAYLGGLPGRDADPARLRAALSRRLPEHMIPGDWVILDALPLTPNGKLDRRALPAPDRLAEREYQPPLTPEEQVLCDLFAQVLALPRVGRHDHFFALGGHSSWPPSSPAASAMPWASNSPSAPSSRRPPSPPWHPASTPGPPAGCP